MTILGFIFWGGLLALIVFGYWMNKKFGSKAPEKSMHQEIREDSIRNDGRY